MAGDIDLWVSGLQEHLRRQGYEASRVDSQGFSESTLNAS